MNDRLDPRALDQAELELAALYALAALAPDEHAAAEREHRDRPAFWAEVRSLRDAAAGLAETGPRARPARDLWPEIRARVSTPAAAPTPADSAALQVWKNWSARPEAGFAPLAASATPFEPTSIAGIRVRRLFVDEASDRVTMLIRMDPGTAYPAHRHGGVEECFVLEGDLEIGDPAETNDGETNTVEMHAGDYQRMDGGSAHPIQSTREGCLLFLVSSRHDELLG